MPKYIDADKFLQDNAYFADRDFVNPKYDDTLRDLIDGAPAADVEPKPKWIPVTERLPEVGKDVLIYAVCKDDDFPGVIAISDRFIFRLFPASDGVETWRSPWQYFMTDYEITHWMPLPEPPKKEKDENDSH